MNADDIRAAHRAQQAAISAADLTAGDDLVIGPTARDWADIRGHWDTSASTAYNPANDDNLARMWAEWLEDDSAL